jgi:hypothetical protein
MKPDSHQIESARNLHGHTPRSNLLLLCLLICFLALYIIAALWVHRTVHDAGSNRFIFLWFPLGYLLFTLTHYIFSALSKSRFQNHDLRTYLLLPFLIVLELTIRRSIMVQEIIPFLYICVMAVKAYILFKHACGVIRIPGKRKLRLSVVFLFTLTVHLSLGLQMIDRTPLQGDEPYFLLMSHSLIHDLDINLENNYLDGDSLNFMGRRLNPQLWDSYSNGKLYSRQTVFLPSLLSPGYLLGGRTGAVISMEILTALLAMSVFSLIYAFLPSVRSAFLGSVLTMFTLPISLYTNKIYTAIPGALLAVLTLVICKKILSSDRRYLFPTVGLILLSGCLKTRLLVLTVPMLCVAHLLRRITFQTLSKILAPIIILLILLGILNTAIYGSPFIRYEFSDLLGTDSVRIARGTLGQIWDGQYGIIPMNPVLLFTLFGLIPFIRSHHRDRRPVIVWLVSFAPYFLIVAAYAELIGGVCPKGRFSVAWIPLMVVPLGYAIKHFRWGLAGSFFRCLTLISLTFTGLMFAHPTWQINNPGGADRFWEAISLAMQTDLLNVFPAFDRPDTAAWVHGIALTIFSLILFIIGWSRYRQKRRWLRSTFPLHSTSVIVFLSVLFLCPLVQWHFSSPWMEVEDRLFGKENAPLFWEEPYNWESRERSRWPYRAGMTLTKGSRSFRTVPLRQPGHSLEIIAAGRHSGNTVPILTVKGNSGLETDIRLRSNRFESYTIPWDQAAKQLTFSMEHTRDSATCSAIIDKVTGRSNTVTCNIAEPLDACLLPIQFGSHSLMSVSLPDQPIYQGQPLKIEMQFLVLNPGNSFEFDCRLSQRYRFIDQQVQCTESGTLEINFTPDPSFGNGKFDILLRPTGQSVNLRPVSPGLFYVNDWIWVNEITIIPEEDPVKETHRKILKQLYSDIDVILPGALHLCEYQQITVPLQSDSSFRSLAFLSNLTDIFTMIPFQSEIGSITLNGKDYSKTFPIVIGRQTAEDMCEFPLPQLKLSHPVPQIASRTPNVLDWPPSLADIEYSSLIFVSEITFPRNLVIDEIVYSSQNHHGVFHIYATGLMAGS